MAKQSSIFGNNIFNFLNDRPIEHIGSKKTKTGLGFTLVCIAFLLYANTINHQYVFDDYLFLTGNTMTQSGIKAIPTIFASGSMSSLEHIDNHNYRPIPKALFAIEWQIAPNNPVCGHLVNVALYMLTCFLLFRMLLLYLKDLHIAFLSALLFTAHPIHTEVVANIKSVDEILSMVFFLSSAIFIHRYITQKSTSHLWLSLLSFTAALLCKESAITYLGAIILLCVFFLDAADRKRQYIAFTCFGASIISCLLLRKIVLGELTSTYLVIENYLYAIPNMITQKITALYILILYIKVLIIPHPLMSDASLQQIPVVHVNDWQFILSLVVMISIFAMAAYGWRKRSIVSFSILYFLCTISVVSNIFVLFGTCYGERLLFSPSLGYCLVLATIITKISGHRQVQNNINSLPEYFRLFRKPMILAGVLIALLSIKTIARNTVWHDDYKLYSTDVKIADKSARSHYFLANHILQPKYLDKIKDDNQRSNIIQNGLNELKIAISIYPEYGEAYNKIAEVLQQSGLMTEAEPYLKKALHCNALNAVFQNNYGNLLVSLHQENQATKYFETAVWIDSNYVHALTNLAILYNYEGEKLRLRKNRSNTDVEIANAKFKSALYLADKALKLAPDFEFASSVRIAIIKNVNLATSKDAEKSDSSSSKN